MNHADHEWLSLDAIDYCELLGLTQGYALLVDAERRIRWLNHAPIARALHHYLNRDASMLVIEEHRPLLRDAIERVLAGGAPVELELQGIETGRWFRLRLSGIARRDAVPGVFIHALDVDEAKRTQTELAIERARVRAAVGGIGEAATSEEDIRRRFDLMADALPVLISYVDDQRRYQYNNAAYERWFGTSREALRGRGVEEVLGTQAYDVLRSHVDAALAGRSVTFEMTIPYKDAGLRRVVARYIPDLLADGEVAGFYTLIEDVSVQREAERALREREEQLRHAQKMEALGQLAGGIAHEFRNLLMTIITGCSAVAESVESGSPLVAMVERVKRAAQRGTSLTRQLLSFSRADELHTEPLDLDAIIGDTAALLERLLESQIELEVDLGAHAWIVADTGQIQQVLMNLAINARDAMPEGGRLRLSTSRVELTPQQAAARGLEAGAHVLLDATDTGTGMDQDTRARIFDPFFTTKAPGEGTGLGLSTVYGIVRKAGGHIEVDSAPEQGTSFRLYFPEGTPEP